MRQTAHIIVEPGIGGVFRNDPAIGLFVGHVTLPGDALHLLAVNRAANANLGDFASVRIGAARRSRIGVDTEPLGLRL